MLAKNKIFLYTLHTQIVKIDKLLSKTLIIDISMMVETLNQIFNNKELTKK